MPVVALRVHADMLRTILRLPDDMAIIDARVEAFADTDGSSHIMAVFLVDTGGLGPDDAVDMMPAYTREPADAVDPIRMHEVCWTNAAGQHTIQSIPAPAAG